MARFFASWRETWNNGDADALDRLYTDDAVLRLPGQVIVRGREPVRAALSNVVETPSTISMSDVDFDSNGENSVVVARYLLTRDGRRTEGIMTAVLYAAGRSWRLRAHIFDAPEDGSVR